MPMPFSNASRYFSLSRSKRYACGVLTLRSAYPAECLARYVLRSCGVVVIAHDEYLLVVRHGCDGVAVFFRLAYDVFQYRRFNERTYAVVYYHDVIGGTSSGKGVDTVAYRLLRTVSAGCYPLQFRDVELVGVGPDEALPTLYAHHAYGVNVGVTLETFERIDQYWLVADVEKLFRYVLAHAIA